MKIFQFRVHWFLILLPRDIKLFYRFFYDYNQHSYFFYRNKGYRVYDAFIVIRTSSKSWKLIYINTLHNVYEYYTFRLCKDVVNQVSSLYEKYKEIHIN